MIIGTLAQYDYDTINRFDDYERLFNDYENDYFCKKFYQKFIDKTLYFCIKIIFMINYGFILHNFPKKLFKKILKKIFHI